MAGEQAKENEETFEAIEASGEDTAGAESSGDERRASENDDDGDEDEGDARVHADADEEAEQRREKRRAERRAKKERRREFRDADRQTIEELRRQNELLQAQMGQITGHLAQTESQRIDADMQRAQQEYQRAEAVYAEAVRTGDGVKATQALRLRDEASARYHKAADLKQRVQQRASQPQVQQQAAPQIDPRVKNHAESFMRKHSWYNPNGSDQDSGIVNAIDNAVAAEGYDQGSPEYWDELEDRMREQLPHRFKKKSARGGPPVGGAGDATRQSGRAIQVRITPERKQAMIDAGAWDDPAKRQRMLKRYAEYDRAARR